MEELFSCIGRAWPAKGSRCTLLRFDVFDTYFGCRGGCLLRRSLQTRVFPRVIGYCVWAPLLFSQLVEHRLFEFIHGLGSRLGLLLWVLVVAPRALLRGSSGTVKDAAWCGSCRPLWSVGWGTVLRRMLCIIPVLGTSEMVSAVTSLVLQQRMQCEGSFWGLGACNGMQLGAVLGGKWLVLVALTVKGKSGRWAAEPSRLVQVRGSCR